MNSLLPRTDEIALMDLARGPAKALVAKVSWEALQRVAPRLFRETGYCPPRFRVDSFPSDEEIRAVSSGADIAS